MKMYMALRRELHQPHLQDNGYNEGGVKPHYVAENGWHFLGNIGSLITVYAVHLVDGSTDVLIARSRMFQFDAPDGGFVVQSVDQLGAFGGDEAGDMVKLGQGMSDHVFDEYDCDDDDAFSDDDNNGAGLTGMGFDDYDDDGAGFMGTGFDDYDDDGAGFMGTGFDDYDDESGNFTSAGFDDYGDESGNFTGAGFDEHDDVFTGEGAHAEADSDDDILNVFSGEGVHVAGSDNDSFDVFTGQGLDGFGSSSSSEDLEYSSAHAASYAPFASNNSFSLAPRAFSGHGAAASAGSWARSWQRPVMKGD